MFDDDRDRRRPEPLPFDAESVRSRLAAYLRGVEEARAAFLFGSRAHGRVRPSSDVDIAVWLQPGTPPERAFDLRLRWLSDLPDVMGYAGDVDVVIANDAPSALGWEISHAPIVLYEAEPGEAGEAAFRLRTRYRDELPRLERRRARLLERIRQGEFGVRKRQH